MNPPPQKKLCQIVSLSDLPSCLYKERTYRTGINRTLVIECPINGSNPDVTYYKMIAPSTRARFEQLLGGSSSNVGESTSDLATLRRMGRFKLAPTSAADFGLYECIPRSLAGTAKCDIHVELGATPNPPEQCSVQLALVNNKTFAQFACRPGFNQGGSVSFLSIYELVDKQLKLSGRVNIDENRLDTDKEVPYITPAEPDSYYEYVVMQENNFGNSTSVLLTLGEPADRRPGVSGYAEAAARKLFTIGAGVVAAVIALAICATCCCSDLIRNDSSCCKCCFPGSAGGASFTAAHNPVSYKKNGYHQDALSYKKAPYDSDPSSNHMHSHHSQVYTSMFATSPLIAAENSASSLSKLPYSASNGLGKNLASSYSPYEFYDNDANSLLLKTTPLYTAGPTSKTRRIVVDRKTDAVDNAGNNDDDDDDDDAQFYASLALHNAQYNNYDDEDDGHEEYENDQVDMLKRGERYDKYEKFTYKKSSSDYIYGGGRRKYESSGGEQKTAVQLSQEEERSGYGYDEKKAYSKKKEAEEDEALFGKTRVKGATAGLTSLNKLTGSGIESVHNTTSRKQQSLSSHFQAELNMKLKSINKTREDTSPIPPLTTTAMTQSQSPPLKSSKANAKATDDECDKEELLYSKNYRLIDDSGSELNAAASPCARQPLPAPPPISSENKKTSSVIANCKQPPISTSSSSSSSSSSSASSTCSSASSNSANSHSDDHPLHNNEQSNYSLIKATINNKPPILKPKPRNNNIYGTTSPAKGQIRSHSPSTSVTEVSNSSNTCTPQHQAALMTTSSPISVAQASQQRPFNGAATTVCTGSNAVTTTFGLKTFSETTDSPGIINNYDNVITQTTLGRNKPNRSAFGNQPSSHTLERRHVKNSEC